MRIGSWEFLKWKHITPITRAEHLRWKKQKDELEEKGSGRNIIITSDDEQEIIDKDNYP